MVRNTVYNFAQWNNPERMGKGYEDFGSKWKSQGGSWLYPMADG
jgi:hypothetical protein